MCVNRSENCTPREARQKEQEAGKRGVGFGGFLSSGVAHSIRTPLSVGSWKLKLGSSKKKENEDKNFLLSQASPTFFFVSPYSVTPD